MHELLDLRICQESDQDPTDIVESIHLIWKNVLLLWNLEDSPGFDQLNDRWKDILSWERSTRKKQVKNDAKLVLATRLCLEQGKIRKKPNFANQKRSPLECLGHFEPIHVWTVLVLAEYFRSLLISHAISCYIHQLLCPHECNMASPSKLGTNLILPEQLYISEMIKTKKESIALAKRLLTHCHKYQISKIIPNQYIPESEESSSELSNESDSDSDILESQLQIGNNSSFTTPLSRNTMSNHSTKLSNNESRISNTSLSVSDVRLPPQPIPPDDYPFHVNQVHPTPSEFEPKSRNSNEQNRQRSRSLDLTSGRKRVPPPPFGSPDDSLKRVSPSTSSSTPKSDSRIFSRAEYRTPIVAFGRSSSTSPLHSKSRSTPENYLLSSSSLRSLEGTSPRTSFDPSDA